MSKLKIAYSPQSADLKHPADRRRIVYWANQRGYEITTDLEAKVDVIVLSSRADITAWTRKRVRPPVVLDIVDGYLGKENLWRDWFRGAGKVLLGDASGYPRAYQKIIIEACSLAQAVVCETPEQKSTIFPFCTNTHAILDFHEEFPILPFNSKKHAKKAPKVMWEGLPFTAEGLLLLEKAFLEISKTQPLEFEMVTDPMYPKYFGKYSYRDTKTLLGTIPEILGSRFNLVEWSLTNVLKSSISSRLSLLPLDPHKSLNHLKAENRLLMMWRIGLPALVSPSLAYSRVMRETQIDGVSSSPLEWQEKILEIIDNPDLCKNSVERGQQYIRETHSKKELLKAWDQLFESIL
jgi:hypothetical protein